MTNIERRALERLLLDLQTVTIAGERMVDGKREIRHHIKEAARLMTSPDYHTGWAECRLNVQEVLKLLLDPDQYDRLVDYVA